MKKRTLFLILILLLAMLAACSAQTPEDLEPMDRTTMESTEAVESIEVDRGEWVRVPPPPGSGFEKCWAFFVSTESLVQIQGYGSQVVGSGYAAAVCE